MLNFKKKSDIKIISPNDVEFDNNQILQVLKETFPDELSGFNNIEDDIYNIIEKLNSLKGNNDFIYGNENDLRSSSEDIELQISINIRKGDFLQYIKESQFSRVENSKLINLDGDVFRNIASYYVYFRHINTYIQESIFGRNGRNSRGGSVRNRNIEGNKIFQFISETKEINDFLENTQLITLLSEMEDLLLRQDRALRFNKHLTFNGNTKEYDQGIIEGNLTVAIDKFPNVLGQLRLQDFFQYTKRNTELKLLYKVSCSDMISIFIEKLKTISKYINTSKIELSFEKEKDTAHTNAKVDFKAAIYFIGGIIGFNVILVVVNLFFTETELSLKELRIFMPLLIIEIVAFKLMFFFFDRYSTYTKIETLYSYYISLLQVDKIYTSDSKFKEDNFALRLKTYDEITKLSSNIVGLIDKKSPQEPIKDTLDIAKNLQALVSKK